MWVYVVGLTMECIQRIYKNATKEKVMTDLQYLALEDMKQLIEDAEVGLFNVKIAKNGV